MRLRIVGILLASLFCFGLCVQIAMALINPNFTPVQLVENGDYILLVKLQPVDKQGDSAAVVVRCVMGKDKAPKQGLVFNVSNASNEDYTKMFKQAIGTTGETIAIMVVGKDEDDEEMGLLHMGGRWVNLAKTDKNTRWEMLAYNPHMEGTWAGGTDMLLRMLDLLVKEPEIEVRVQSGVEWEEGLPIATLKGAVSQTQTVDLQGKGNPVLYFASDAGDQIFVFDTDAGEFTNRTGALKLTAKSRVSAWADVNGDGKIDLASWDGKQLRVFHQQADGTFAPGADVEAAPEETCLALAAIDAGSGKKAGLLWSDAKGAVVLTPKDDSFAARRMAPSDADAKALGPLGPCVVGDLDGDGLADILQLATKASLLHRGAGNGAFTDPQKLPIALGEGGNGACLGDWDLDGRLDVFCTSTGMPQLWHNRDGLKFSDRLYVSGEIAYIAKPGAIAGHACDVNADGLQDVVLIYGEDASCGPQIFFNRGFQSFGHGHHIDLSEQDLLEGAEAEGQQAGLIADLNRDGAEDFVIVLKNGEATFFPNTAGEWGVYGLRVALPTGASITGPVKVTAWDETRCLGSRNVVAGTSEAYFGQVDPGGTLTIEWQLPGKKPQKKTFTIEDKLVRHVLGQ